MSGSHARLAPSSAHRWLECPGSVTLEDPCPDVTSDYADEGTILHDIIARHLPHVRATRETSLAHLIGQKFKGEKVTLEIDDAIADALQSCGQCALDHSFAAPNTIAAVEQRIAIPGRDDIWGTSDLSVLDIPLRRLSVIDWKFGMGVKVFAKENPQLIIYALGVLIALELFYEIERVRIVIHQPRLNHHDEWEISVDELRAWLPKILAGAKRTDVERNTYHDGDWCLFCKAKANCPQLRKTGLALAQREFARIEQATGDELAETMRQIPRIEAVIRAVEGEVLGRLARGEEVPGFKTVEGRRSRSWADELIAEASVRELFGDEGYTLPTLKSPAQIEALAKRTKTKLPDGLFAWSKGALHVVPAGDERAALTSAQLDFSPIVEREDL